jgi:hypothetical protein
MNNYTLDAESAKLADNINARIETSGKYQGIITRAEQTTSTKGTSGVDFSFKSDSGESADYLTIWTHNKDGKQLMGFNTLMALMTCLRVRELNAENGEVEKYDSEQKKRVKVTVPLFKDLMNKPICLLLQMEEYPKTQGGTGWKPTIFGVFDKDEFTASEILSKVTKAEKLQKMVLSLKDRPLKGAAVQSSGAAPSDASGSLADFDDDIPF